MHHQNPPGLDLGPKKNAAPSSNIHHDDHTVQQFQIQRSAMEDAPMEYPEEKKTKNIVGLMTKAAAQVQRYLEPKWVDPSLPKLYEHYAKGGITKGLEAVMDGFFLNGKPITIYSGELHYFRVHPRNWRDRLRKMRACGLNCVSTYIPWNVHEPEKDKFDFGDADFDLTLFADVATFMRLAYEEDLFVIIKPGPFICAEWELGGLPSWLLRTPNLKIRTSEAEFMSRVEKYFTRMLALCKPFQFQKSGPVIAIQIENEYGSAQDDGVSIDNDYIMGLKNLILKCGINEMLYTADHGYFGRTEQGSIDGVLKTTCFQSNAVQELNGLRNQQPDKPCFVSSFWDGWFDHWMHSASYYSLPLKEFSDITEAILKFPASVNFYMFHGGTNWGFMNGANVEETLPYMVGYQPNCTSYDFNAPISEGGDYNEKFMRLQQMLRKYNTVRTRLPSLPNVEPKMSYLSVWIKDFLSFEDIVHKIPQNMTVKSPDLLAMEHLDVNNENGQAYGYILYRKTGLTINNGDIIKIMGHVRDIAIVLIDGIPITKQLSHVDDRDEFGFWAIANAEKSISVLSGSNKTLEILVENCGRANFGVLSELPAFKGLVEGPVMINDEPLMDWEISAVEFKSKWVKSLNGFRPLDNKEMFMRGPALYHATLELETEPMDTWLDMSQWKKGVVFINGFNIGRYLFLGPPTTLYCPAGFLRRGKNEILIFEHYQFNRKLSFTDKPQIEQSKKATPILN